MSEKETGKKPFVVGDGTPGPGRKKGVPNKNTTALKDMILKALEQSGGVEYLVVQARDNPGPFLSLIGKVLPMTLANADGGNLTINVLTGVPRGDD